MLSTKIDGKGFTTRSHVLDSEHYQLTINKMDDNTQTPNPAPTSDEQTAAAPAVEETTAPAEAEEASAPTASPEQTA